MMFHLNLPKLRAPFEPNLDGRCDSVTTSLQKPLAGPASIVQNGPARSLITIRDAEVKRAEIGRLYGILGNLLPMRPGLRLVVASSEVRAVEGSAPLRPQISASRVLHQPDSALPVDSAEGREPNVSS